MEAKLETNRDKLMYNMFKKSRKGLSKDVIAKFTISAKNKFTTNQGREVRYGYHVFSNKGINNTKFGRRTTRRCQGVTWLAQCRSGKHGQRSKISQALRETSNF